MYLEKLGFVRKVDIRLRIGPTNRHFGSTVAAKYSKSTQKNHEFLIYITYEILPIKKYASLWYKVWHKVKTCHLYMEKLDFVRKVDIRLRIGPIPTAILL